MASSGNQIGQQIDATIVNFIAGNDIVKLVQQCEDYEINFGSNSDVRLSDLYWTAFLWGYLIVNDLNNARFLWKRIPKDTKNSNRELNAVWKVGQSAWQRNHQAVYQIISQTQWSKNYRFGMLRLLSKSYTNISEKDLSSYLGVDANEASQFAQQLGWTHDSNTAFYTTSRKVFEQEYRNKRSGLNNLQTLTDRTLFLELE